MKPSARAFLERLFDYAGMFPPASLPLEPSLRNYLQYTRQESSWMLGRFICAAENLPRLAALVTDNEGPPVPLSVLVASGKDFADSLETLVHNLAMIREHSGPNGRLRVEVLEARLPLAATELADGPALQQFFAGVQQRLADTGQERLEVFFEAAAEEDRGRLWQHALQALGEHNQARRRSQPEFGFKLRCGGLAAAAFPTVDELALALQQAHHHRIKLKATAGLHHPVRHFDRALGVHRHGFLNIFGAGILLHAAPLEEETLREILLEEEPGSFRFEEDGFRWKGFRCSTARLRKIRSRYVTSLGSCSFDEPREDLVALGWLPRSQLAACQ